MIQDLLTSVLRSLAPVAMNLHRYMQVHFTRMCTYTSLIFIPRVCVSVRANTHVNTRCIPPGEERPTCAVTLPRQAEPASLLLPSPFGEACGFRGSNALISDAGCHRGRQNYVIIVLNEQLSSSSPWTYKRD